jgi:hypothetical protein
MNFIDKLKKRSWRLWFRVIHRDLGFLIFGLTVIYAISGITLNHINDFNPNYSIDSRQLELSDELLDLNAEELCLKIDDDLIYKKHIDRADGARRIFVQGGIIDIVPSKNIIQLEILNRRPFFYEANYLHYNRSKLWIWFSDIFAVILIIVSISGLFLVKGKYGIKKYGLIWTLIGILIPTIFLMLVI